MIIKKILLFLGMFGAVSASHCEQLQAIMQETSHLQHVLESTHLRYELSKFIDAILRQVPSERFFELIDTLDCQSAKNDAELYEQLLTALPQILPKFQAIKKLTALQHQKSVLGPQIISLLGTQTICNGAVEIGSPATYLSAIRGSVGCTGNVYAMTDKKRFSDRLQAFVYNPLKGFVAYNKFVALNNYEQFTHDDIPTNSVDLVVCLIGLHHIPDEKLDGFVQSIHRILRPGGTFIVREHDAYDAEMLSLIWSAHAVYNAIMSQTSVQDEGAEYRNFKPLSYWIELLQNNGFAARHERLRQDGDPTYNTMMAFTKNAVSELDKLQDFSRFIEKNDVTYKRDLTQSYLTTPEWVNVDVAKEYGEYIDHTPFYEFPYMKSVGSYWKAFAASWRSAAQRSGHMHVLTSPYTLMNLFTGVTMSVEYGAKSLVALPVRMMFAGAEAGKIKMIVHDPYNELGQFSDRITILQEDDITGFRLIELTRYKEFLQTIKNLQNSRIVIKEIAGQYEVQVKIKGSSELGMPAEDTADCKVEYSWELPTAPGVIYYAVSVQTEKLLSAVSKLEAHGYEIMYIHDF